MATASVLFVCITDRKDILIGDAAGPTLPIHIILVAYRNFCIRIQLGVPAYSLLRQVQIGSTIVILTICIQDVATACLCFNQIVH